MDCLARPFAFIRRPARSLVLLLALLLAGCASGRPPSAETDAAADGAAQVEDPVNVGYGTVTKTMAASAVNSVRVDENTRSSVQRLEDLIVGRVAGVEVRQMPGGRFSVTIRGTSSIYGSNEPLYVVDGVAASPAPGGGLLGIHVEDIASIEILKDAGAAAIYGSRAANGVVVITTRRARNW